MGGKRELIGEEGDELRGNEKKEMEQIKRGGGESWG